MENYNQIKSCLKTCKYFSIVTTLTNLKTEKSILGNVFVIKKSSKKSSKHSLSSFFSVCASREEEEKDEGRPLQAAFQEELHHAAGGGGESDALSPLSDWLKGGR